MSIMRALKVVLAAGDNRASARECLSAAVRTFCRRSNKRKASGRSCRIAPYLLKAGTKSRAEKDTGIRWSETDSLVITKLQGDPYIRGIVFGRYEFWREQGNQDYALPSAAGQRLRFA